jgi:pyruvate/2-oxoglutarate dehydrogenase complex dihydrolipoamide acyltransferase (E2) component
MLTSNVPGRFVRSPSSWRQMASATWHRANDPTIYGTLDLDATAAVAYAHKLSEQAGKRVTLTPIVVAALGRTLAKHPDCNAYIRLGRTYQRENIDIFVLVAVPPAAGQPGPVDLSGVKIERADKKTPLQIAEELEQRVTEVRGGHDPALDQVKRAFKFLPPLLTKIGLKATELLQYELNLDLSSLGIPRDSFGSAFVTNVGAIGPGVGHAFPPIVPMTRLSMNVAMGALEDRPVVVDGAVVVRPVLPLTATFDHRVIDGFQGAKLSGTFCEILRHPDTALLPG